MLCKRILYQSRPKQYTPVLRYEFWLISKCNPETPGRQLLHQQGVSGYKVKANRGEGTVPPTKYIYSYFLFSS
jgi:hypothetical protein